MALVDIHCHLLYGVDDGPTTPREMGAMLAAAAVDGVRAIVATPHVAPGLTPLDGAALRAKVAEAQALSEAAELDLRIFLGAEVLYTDQTVTHLEEGRVPTLAGTRSVLVELPPDAPIRAMIEACEALSRAGYTPVLAHVERYECLLSRPARARQLKKCGARLQVNCSALLGRGFCISRLCDGLIADGLIDAVASNAHDTVGRPAAMTRAYSAIRARWGEDCARLLTGGSAITGPWRSAG